MAQLERKSALSPKNVQPMQDDDARLRARVSLCNLRFPPDIGDEPAIRSRGFCLPDAVAIQRTQLTGSEWLNQRAAASSLVRRDVVKWIREHPDFKLSVGPTLVGR